MFSQYTSMWSETPFMRSYAHYPRAPSFSSSSCSSSSFLTLSVTHSHACWNDHSLAFPIHAVILVYTISTLFYLNVFDKHTENSERWTCMHEWNPVFHEQKQNIERQKSERSDDDKMSVQKTEFKIVRVLFKNKIVRFFVKLQLISCNNEVCVCRVSYSKS